MGAIRNPTMYMAGQRIKVTCKSGYHFWGEDSWYCNHDGDWEGDSWGREEEWPMCLTVRHTAEWSSYVATASAGGLIIILIILACIAAKNKRAPPRKNPFRGDEEAYSMSSIHKDPNSGASSIPSI